jgi:hypothetical protein
MRKRSDYLFEQPFHWNGVSPPCATLVPCAEHICESPVFILTACRRRFPQYCISPGHVRYRIPGLYRMPGAVSEPTVCRVGSRRLRHVARRIRPPRGKPACQAGSHDQTLNARSPIVGTIVRLGMLRQVPGTRRIVGTSGVGSCGNRVRSVLHARIQPYVEGGAERGSGLGTHLTEQDGGPRLHGSRSYRIIADETPQGRLCRGCKCSSRLRCQPHTTDQRFHADGGLAKFRAGIRRAEHHAADQTDGQRILAAPGRGCVEYKSSAWASRAGQPLGNVAASRIRQACEAIEVRHLQCPFQQRGCVNTPSRQPKHLLLQGTPGGIEIERAACCRWVSAYRHALNQEVRQPSLRAKPRIHVAHAKCATQYLPAIALTKPTARQPGCDVAAKARRFQGGQQDQPLASVGFRRIQPLANFQL